MTHLIASLRIRALGVAVRLVPAPTPFMLTGPGSSVELARLIADRGARSVLVVTDQVLVELKVVVPVLNASVGIPPTIEQIADADIPEIVQRALVEAHGTYPVPMYMSAADCATIVRRAAGRVMVAATDDRSGALGARPEKEDI